MNYFNLIVACILSIIGVVLLTFINRKYYVSDKYSSVQKMTIIGVFSALTVILMYLGIPFMADYLKIEFSVALILLVALIVDFKTGIYVSIIANVTDFILKGSVTGIPIDQIANFSASMVFLAVTFYFVKNKKLIFGLISGVLMVTIVMLILNYTWITPFYFNLAGWPLPDDLFMYIIGLYGPFNLVKWTIVGIVTVGLYNATKRFI